MQRQGWNGDPLRHSLASSGVKTRKAVGLSCDDMTLKIYNTKSNKVEQKLQFKKVSRCDFINILDAGYTDVMDGIDRMQVILTLGLFKNEYLHTKILAYLLMKHREILKTMKDFKESVSFSTNIGKDMVDSYRYDLYMTIKAMNISDTIENELIESFYLKDIEERIKRDIQITEVFYEKGFIPKPDDNKYLHPLLALMWDREMYFFSNNPYKIPAMITIRNMIWKLIGVKEGKLTKKERNALIAYLMRIDPLVEVDSLNNHITSLIKSDAYRTIGFLVIEYPKERSTSMKDIKKINSLFGSKFILEKHYDKTITFLHDMTLLDIVMFMGNNKQNDMPLAMKEMVYLNGVMYFVDEVISATPKHIKTPFFAALKDVMVDNGIENYNTIERLVNERDFRVNHKNKRTYKFFYAVITDLYDRKDELIRLYKDNTDESRTKAQKIIYDIIKHHGTKLNINPDTMKQTSELMGNSILKDIAKYKDSEIEKEPLQIYDNIKESFNIKFWGPTTNIPFETMMSGNKSIDELIDEVEQKENQKIIKNRTPIRAIYKELTPYNKRIFADTIKYILKRYTKPEGEIYLDMIYNYYKLTANRMKVEIPEQQ